MLDFFSSSLSFASVLGIFYCLAPTYIYIYIDNFFFLSKAGSYIFFNILKFNDCFVFMAAGIPSLLLFGSEGVTSCSSCFPDSAP